MEPFKVSLTDLLDQAGFEQTGTENGTPVYSMKKELTEDQIDESDELFFDYKD
jgi:hypothetical protein